MVNGSSESTIVKRRMAGGVAWMLGLRVSEKLIGLLSTVILARLLVPADFGLIALAATTVAMVEMAGELGLEMALIRDQEAHKDHYDTVWTMRIIKNLLTSVMLVILAAPAAAFFEEPRLTSIVYALAFATAITGFSNIGTVNFTKKLEFGKVFLFNTTQRLVRFSITVVLAFIWRDYWALVVGIVSSKVLSTIFSYIIHPYRPKLSLKEWREIMGFSKWILVTSTATFLNKNSDKFLIGKMMNTSSVGLFSVAYEISNMVSSELIAPVKRVSFPAFSKLADDQEKLKTTYLELLSILAIFSLPLAAGIGLTSDLLVKILLGDQWLDAIPLMGVLALYGLIESARSQTRPLFMAMNKPKISAYVSIGKAILFVPLFFAGMSYNGLQGAAWSCIIIGLIVLAADFILVRRIAGVAFSQIVDRLWRPGVATAVMYISVSAFRQAYPFSNNLFGHISEMLLCVLLGAGVYFSSLILLWIATGRPQGAEKIIFKFLVKRRTTPG